ncbi:hypothetical protein CAEBREN_12170 [Caenorhabditis brenneri]|uniref:6-phosphofructo-2-kinase domain-containing protein n=1 Tax=Caenorhabditis brenneri TaxID=135651 RepID=G0P8K6_CAEBE|nr:hypothetical protein CAEBREN_12170 [Caenorhabditis brenneri]
MFAFVHCAESPRLTKDGWRVYSAEKEYERLGIPKSKLEYARLAIEDMGRYLDAKEGEVAILDTTNTTRERRHILMNYCKNLMHEPPFRVFFVESVSDDKDIINSNITEVKINSPDYKGIMSQEEAKEDFLKRIENYRMQYRPLDEGYDEELSYIKVINAGKSFYLMYIFLLQVLLYRACFTDCIMFYYSTIAFFSVTIKCLFSFQFLLAFRILFKTLIGDLWA